MGSLGGRAGVARPRSAAAGAGVAPRVGTWMKRMAPITEGVCEVEEEEVGGATASTSDDLSDPGGRCRSPDRARLGDPFELKACAERAADVVGALGDGSRSQRRELVEWLLDAAPELALSRHGCRVVQKALEVAAACDRDALAERLGGCVMELCRSPHGNHVLARLVEVTPSASIGFVVAELAGQGAAVARHQFGSRVLERLIEHCSEAQVLELMRKVGAEIPALCQHRYGNFVVQRLLEYGSGPCRSRVLEQMLPQVPALAMHRIGCHVVQRALACGDAAGRRAVAAAMLGAGRPHSIVEAACDPSGSIVVQELLTLRPHGLEVWLRLAEGLPLLLQSQAGRQLAGRLGPPIAISAEGPGGDGHCLAAAAA